MLKFLKNGVLPKNSDRIDNDKTGMTFNAHKFYYDAIKGAFGEDIQKRMKEAGNKCKEELKMTKK